MASSSVQCHVSPTRNTILAYDSGVLHHIKSDLANLSMHSPYTGNDEVLIGDGEGLQITHTGSSLLPSPTRSLYLHNVLRVSDIAKNLASVKKLCTNNSVSMEFFPDDFQVKDLKMEASILTGQTKNGGYEWPCRYYPSFAFSSSLNAHCLFGTLDWDILLYLF